MQYVVCSVFDYAMGTYGRPLFVVAKGQAVRSFTDEVNREHEANEMYRHPDDFWLFHVGSFDDQTGRLLPLSEPELLVKGSDVKVK